MVRGHFDSTQLSVNDRHPMRTLVTHLNIATSFSTRLPFAASAILLLALHACGGDSGDQGGADGTDTKDVAPDSGADADAAVQPDMATETHTPDGVDTDAASDADAADPCAGVMCAPAPCKVNGRCSADSAPTCVYDDAPDDTVCDLPGVGDGIGDGVCEAGACRLPTQPCTTNDQCALAGTSCVQGECAIRGIAGAPCEESVDCAAGYVCEEGGTCVGDRDVPCGTDDDCLHTCHEGLCSWDSRFGGPCYSTSPSLGCLPGLICGQDLRCVHPPGGACVDDSECGAPATCDPTKKTCVVEQGSSCDDDDQCREVCLVTFCSSRSPFGWPCGEDSDCEDRLACDPPATGAVGQCRQADGEPCFDDGMCLSDSKCALPMNGPPGELPGTCERRPVVGEACGPTDPCVSSARCSNGVCVPLSPVGGPCTGTSDCADGVCSAGSCRLVDGVACSDNDQCVNTCVSGQCAATCLTCACDDTEDCGPSLSCRLTVGDGHLTCLYPLGSECQFTGPNSLCVNGWCTARRCADPSGPGGPCLNAEDCAQGLLCGSDRTCGKPNGQPCSTNGECLNTCLGQVCGDYLGFQGSCSGDSEDCGPGLACVGNRCLSADPGTCECRTFQNQCVGTINDECNPGFKPSRVSPCSCPTACECIPE